MNTMVATYTKVQKFFAVVLLFAVLATSVLTTELGLNGIFGGSAKAIVDGTVTSFLEIPEKIINVDAGITQDKLGLPNVVGANVEKDGVSKKAYFDAVWECSSFSDETALNTEYVFTLASTSVPASIAENVKLPSITVKSGKYCIKGFKEISADLVAKAVTSSETVDFPTTVEAFVGNDTETTSVKVNWVSFMETIEGGSSRAFTDTGSKHAFKAEIVETDVYYLCNELTEKNLAAHSVPYITVYVIGDSVAYVGANGFANLTEAYEYINQNGGSGTIVIDDFYSYFVDDDTYDPSFTIVKTTGDNYSDSYFNEPAHSGMVVIKGNTPDAVLEFSYRFYVNGDLMFKDLTLKTKYSMKERVYAGGNDLVFGTGLTCKWDSELSEGYVMEYSNAFRIYGGSASTDLRGDTRVVLLSGDYYLVRGGNEEGGTVYGDTFVYLGGTAHTYYQLMGGSRRGNVAGSTYVIVNGNAVADAKSGGPDEKESVAVFGGGLEGTVNGDRDGDGISEGGCHVLICGGTLNAAATGSGSRETYSGKTYVTVCGNALIKAGAQGALYGVGDSSNGAISNDDVYINIFCNARLVSNGSVYANVYGTNTENNIDSDIEINVYGNAFVEGSINGGSYLVGSGVGSAVTGEKVINVTISESAFIRLNVYGGSLRKGVYGDTNVVVKGNATVKGNVYGGGQGAASVSVGNEYGKAFDSTVLVQGNVYVGNVYGGGNYGYNTGNTVVTVKDAQISGSVFGGSSSGGVAGNSTVNLYGAKVQGSVYGGNEEECVIYSTNVKTDVNVLDGTVVKGSVYGGAMASDVGDTFVNVADSTVNGSVFGGCEIGSTETAVVNVYGNTTIKGDVHGAGKEGNVNDATVNVSSGFINNIYGGGITGYANKVEINITGTENDFNYEITGEVNGLPKAPVSESDIAANFTSDSEYILNIARFKGHHGKNFAGSGSVKSISNFSQVNIASSQLTFVDTEGEYFTGITELYLKDASSKLELPGKATLCSAFNAGGVYSTSKTNVLPSMFSAAAGSDLSMPSRTSTDEEEAVSAGKVSAIFTVYGKIVGECDLYLDGEKKSGTYVTSFADGSNVGSSIAVSTEDYFYKNENGDRVGHNRNFSTFMANDFNTGTFKMVGLNEVHESGRVFTTVTMGSVGALDGKNTSNWIIWSAGAYANIVINKVGETEIDGATVALEGVEFTIYSDAECQNAIETVTTNANGYAITSDLSANDVTYYVKETKTGDNYTLDTKVYSVTLTPANSGGVVELTDSAIVNFLKYGQINIVKTSDDGVLLEGVSFLVTGDNGFVKTIITDASGVATTGKILYGEYTIVEVSNPNAGFEEPSFNKTVTVNEQGANWNIDVVNNRVTGKVTLTKVDEEGNALAGVIFNVYSDKELNNIVDTITTDSNGYAETKALTIYGEATTYYVVEAVTLDGYLLREDVFEVTLTPDSKIGLAADDNDRVIRNYFERASISILKKGENDALLEGVSFGIYADAECTDRLETIVTDANGNANSTSLKLGTYYVKEISNPDKTYIVSEKVYKFDLTENGKVYSETVYNIKAGAFISLEKIDSHGKPVAGVKFEIRNSAGELVETITTDEKGNAISSVIVIASGEENVYTVKEVYAPDYVYMSETVYEAVLTEDNQVFELNNGEPIVNKVKEGYLTLNKVNESGAPLAGVEFTVYSDESLAKEVAVIVTDENGKGTSTNLPFGTYYVKETANPDKSYVISTQVFVVQLNDEDGTEIKEELYVPVSKDPIVNYKATASISLIKKDELGNPLEGVEFTVFDSEMNFVCKIYTAADGKAVTGNLVINDGVNGTKYYVVETKALEGYKLDDTKYEVVLVNNGSVVAVNDGKAIVNEKLVGSVTVTYTAKNDANNQSVPVNVILNGTAFVGEYTLNGQTFQTTDGIINVKDGDSFVIELICGDTYTVYASTESLENLVSITYNGVESENKSGTIDEDNLKQQVDIIAEFVIPADPGDMGTIFFFIVLAAISAFGMAFIEYKKRRIRG